MPNVIILSNVTQSVMLSVVIQIVMLSVVKQSVIMLRCEVILN
jgi:hypothetical protein